MAVIDIGHILDGLAAERPVFHSEKDFQVGFGMEAVKALGTPVRLEYRPTTTEKVYLDVYMPRMGLAVELKYKTRRLEAEIGGERFSLTDQRAHDNGRYDFLADLQRLEGLVASDAVEWGVAILLTNDPLYWSAPRWADTEDAAFQLEDGSVLDGELAWQTKRDRRKRESPINLRRSHRLAWRDYSVVGVGGCGGTAVQGKHRAFRYLAVACDRSAS